MKTSIKTQLSHIAEDILNMDVCTIIKPEITARKMPDVTIALQEIGRKYEYKFKQMDIKLDPDIRPVGTYASFEKIRELADHEIMKIKSLKLEKTAETANICVMIAPNFALGAVLMMHLAKIAGKYLDHAEIVELHHDRKVDSPSGTAMTTARSMVESRCKPFLPPAVVGESTDGRGLSVQGINIHSVRLPGLMAHQEVILGTAGQILSIRHDTINRECYMPGVLVAIKEVVKRKGYIYGLDKVLGL